jgi:hypothetical protein
MMKRFFTIIILFIFVFNICGYYIPYFIKLTIIRNEIEKIVKESIPDEYIVKITIDTRNPGDNPEWMREGKEFRYKGDMYDVIKSETHNGRKTYFCINDKEEKNLGSNFNKLLSKKLENEGKTKTNSQKELGKYYSFPSKGFSPVLKEADLTDYFSNLYRSPQMEILSPPPRTV